MAKVLDNFLIGIGLEFDDQGAKNANTAMDSIKRTALQAGTAIAGAFGVQAVTAGVADNVAQLSRFAEVNGITAQEVQALGMALERQGGSISGFIDQIGNIEQLRARMLKGDFSFIPEGALSGVDTSAIINAESAIEAYLALAEQFPNLSQQQRLNAAEVFGLDQASILLLTQGRETVESQMMKFARMREITNELEKSSIELQREWQDMWDNVGGITDRAGTKIIPKVADLFGQVNRLMEENRDFVNDVTDDTGQAIADNFETITAGTSLLAGSQLLGGIGLLAKKLPLVGNGFASVASGLARFSGAAGALLMVPAASQWIDDMLSNLIGGYDEFDAAFTKRLYDITGFDASEGKVYENADKNKPPQLDPYADLPKDVRARLNSGSYGENSSDDREIQARRAMIPQSGTGSYDRQEPVVVARHTATERVENNETLERLIERNERIVNNERMVEREILSPLRVNAPSVNPQVNVSPAEVNPQINVPEPTVLPPDRIAPISAPVMQAQQQAAQAQQMVSQQQQSASGSVRYMQPVTLNLDGRPIRRMVVETVEAREDQTRKDFDSPVER